MTDRYREIAEELQALFPAGTLQTGDGKNHVHIPAQVYIKRLEDVAAGDWSWRLTGEPIYKETDQVMTVMGELKILNTTRTGIGFSFYSRAEGRSITAYKNAVNAAESDAIRNACDKFLMGWKDLAPYREWAKNPGVGLQEASKGTVSISDKVCTRCQKPLSTEEQLFLDLNSIRISYCFEHIPKHLKKKTEGGNRT